MSKYVIDPNFTGIFDCEPAFWIFMGITAGITLAYIIVCWVLPPKKQKEAKERTEDKFFK